MADSHGDRWKTLGGITVLTLVAAGVLGYHPCAEDGGIYLAEIKRALDPSLYPFDREFVAGHLGWSAFTSSVVWVVRVFGWKLEGVMLALHLLSIWGLLWGIWQLARRSHPNSSAQWGAVGMVALCLTMPIAGTSLLLMDPYVTARSLCLALTVLGTAGVANFLTCRRWRNLAWGLAMLAAALAIHPLMAGYWAGSILVVVFVLAERRWVRMGGLVGLLLAALAVAALTQRFAAVETPEYVHVAATRYYWFLGQWRWFELAGLWAPLAILGWTGWGVAGSKLARGLARMAVSAGSMAVVIALLFARQDEQIHAVARMQPLRCFQVVYIVLLMTLGAWLGQTVLRNSMWRWGMTLAVLGGLMVFVQRQTYPASGHLELPGAPVLNQWEQAFLWIRGNTPKNALFSLDADYVHSEGEDAQGFRALAERSVLPDFSKDGGQAAIRPDLTAAWLVGQTAQARLTTETDEERMRALAPLGATWMVIGQEGITRFVCPYKNPRVKVCRLP